MAKTLMLTGRPGVGKTSVIVKLVDILGERADGFYTEEICQSGARQGFRLMGLRGESGTLAHIALTESCNPRVGRYGVDVAALDRVGVAAIERGLAAEKVIIVDEIGKMELYSKAFKNALLQAMNSEAPVIATVLAASHGWVDTLKTRPDVTLWQVTMENRDQMPARIMDWLTGDAGLCFNKGHANEM